MAALVHVAGPVIAAQQRCSRCGHLLEVPEGHRPGLPFWREGASVMVDGNAAFFVSGDDDGHLNCKPAS